MREQEQSPERTRRAMVLLLCGLLSIPFVIGLIQTALELREPLYLYGDQAITGVSVIRSAEFLQLVGPYSRFGFAHPGPLIFFLLAPTFLITKHNIGLSMGALLINWGFLLGIVVLLGRRVRPLVTASIVTVFAVYLVNLGPTMMRNEWGPAIVVTPLLFALIAAAVRPTVASTCAMAFALSLALQTHFGTAAQVGAVLLVALALHVLASAAVVEKWPQFAWLNGDLKAMRLIPSRKAVGIVSGFTLFLWLPPIIQQFSTGVHGNFGSMLKFNITNSQYETHTLAEGFERTLQASWLPSVPLLKMPPPAPGSVWAWVLLWLVVAAIGLVIAFRRQMRIPSAMFLFAITGFLFAGIATSRIHGEIFVYLLWWSGIPIVAFLCGVATLIFSEKGIVSVWNPKLARIVVAVAAVVMVIPLTVSTFHNRSQSRFSFWEVARGTEVIENDLGRRKGVLLLDTPDLGMNPTHSGIIETLILDGYAVRATPNFGHPYETRPSKNAPIAHYKIAAKASGGDTGGVVVATYDGMEPTTIRRMPM